MIPTPPTTPGSSRRRSYPTSSRYWQDHRPSHQTGRLVDVGVQTPPIPPPCSPSSRTLLNTTLSASRPRQYSEQIDAVNVPLGPPLVLLAAQVQLSKEQTKVLEIVKSGESVFFTGPAGKCCQLWAKFHRGLNPYRFWEIRCTSRNHPTIIIQSQSGSDYRRNRGDGADGHCRTQYRGLNHTFLGWYWLGKGV